MRNDEELRRQILKEINGCGAVEEIHFCPQDLSPRKFQIIK